LEELNEGHVILEGESNPVSPEAVTVTKISLLPVLLFGRASSLKRQSIIDAG
jgi:hypothetical protein